MQLSAMQLPELITLAIYGIAAFLFGIFSRRLYFRSLRNNNEPAWSSDYLQGISTELFGALLTAFLSLVVVGVFASESEIETRQRLYDALTSPDATVAQQAYDELRQLGWLSNGSMSNVELGAVNLPNTDLSYVNWAGSDLQGADFSGSTIRSANLSDTDLQGANLSNTQINTSNFASANLSNTDLSNSYILNSDFSTVRVFDANLSGVQFILTNVERSLANEGTILPGGATSANPSLQTYSQTPSIDSFMNLLASCVTNNGTYNAISQSINRANYANAINQIQSVAGTQMTQECADLLIDTMLYLQDS